MKSQEEHFLGQIAPSDDFRETVDTTRFTQGVCIGLTADGTMEVQNEIAPAAVTVPITGTYHPLATKTAISVAGYTVVYCYRSGN